MKSGIYKLGLLAMLLFVAACGDSKERIPADAPGYVDGKPIHPTIKIGKPYKVLGEEYYPKYEPDYVEEGLASWYGPDFHGKSTANGETYNQWAMTAAHKTLPMPSMVKVIHQKTGKWIMVRVNDRGPFSDKRIIDLSRAAAEELGIVREGVAPVRVEYMKPETEEYIAKLNFKKPDEWKEIDMAQAQSTAMPPVQAVPTDSISVTDMPEPVRQPADSIPEVYAETHHGTPIKTTDIRGVTIEEFGYADDAFSVLKDEQAPRANATSPPTNSPFQVARYDPDEHDPPDRATPAVATAAPVETLATSRNSRYFVQAGTFGNKDNAMRLADKLSAFSAVDVSELVSSEKPLYRVRLGPTHNESVAEELLVRLYEHGIRDAKIMKE